MYRGFIDRINLRVNALFDEIQTIYNFDNGDEFEVAICKILLDVLPQKYGVCRGHIITKDGDQAGDDIIIYDKHNFPLLRLLNEDSLWRKQFVPVESVYAFIEAKNTLYINGNHDQSLQRAINQLSKIKVLKRKATSLGKINQYVTVDKEITRAKGWPAMRNPIYGCIFSRNLKIDNSKRNSDVKEKIAISALATMCSIYSKPAEIVMPDMIIAGKSGLFVPAVDGEFLSPFHLNGTTKITSMNVKAGSAFGVGLVNLIYALNDILLNDIYWPEIIANGARVELTNRRE